MTVDVETSATDSSGVTLVIPVYNEERGIADTLRIASEALSAAGIPFEIVVVDDASEDESVHAVESSGVTVRLLRHDRNQGYGATLKTGFAVARHDLIAFLDADGSYPAKDLPVLIAEMAHADMVVGQRMGYHDHSSRARTLGQSILIPLAKYLTDTDIPDLNSGMRVVRRDLLELYWPLLPDGFSLTTTITLALLSAGRRVKWVPVEFRARRGHSKIRPVRDMTNFVHLILRTVTYFKPLRVYLPLSAILVFLSVAVVIITKLAFDRVWDVTALFLFIAGLQMLLIGVIADLVLKTLGTRR